MVGRQQLTESADIKAIADKFGATAAQVLVAWGAHRGYTVIPKSVQESRIKSNFQQVELSKEDYEKICEIGKKDPIRHDLLYFFRDWQALMMVQVQCSYWIQAQVVNQPLWRGS